jgi:hypothetical protein
MAAAANTETALPIAIAAYIDAYRETVGLPASTALPCRTFIRDADADYPRIFVTVNGGIESPHPRRLSLPVTVEVQCRMEDTAPTDEDAWLAALHRLLADADAMRTWMAANAQPFSLRTARLTAISTGIDPEKQIRGRRTDLTIHLRAHELAPILAAA